MRISSIALLGAATLVICISSSSSSNKTEVNVQTSARSDAHSSVSVDRLMRAQNTTIQEERMLENVAMLMPSELNNHVRGIVQNAMKTLHTSRCAYTLTDEALGQLQELDSRVLTPFAVEIHRYRIGKNVPRNIPRIEGKRALFRVIVQQAKDTKDDEKHLVRAILSQKDTPMEDHDQVERDTTPEGGDFNSDLIGFVNRDGTSIEYDSLNMLSRAVGGAARLAPIVSIAKKSQIMGHQAKRLQHAMLTSWLHSGKSVDDVFDILKLSDLRRRGYTYENLDTLAQYISICNKKQRKQIDMLTYLRGKFGDGDLALMILKVANTPQVVNEPAVRQQVGGGKLTVDFVSSIIAVAVNVNSLLDPLSLAFGGAARLAPIVSILKKGQASAIDAKRLQSAMLASWLNRGKSIGDVFNILELSNLGNRGFTYENLDTLEQYIAVFNKRHGFKIGMFTYLRVKFGDGELAMMILKETKVSEYLDEEIVRERVGEGISHEDFVNILLAIPTNVYELLDPLLAAFGGAAKLAPFLSIVKKEDYISHSNAGKLQHAMLTSWLNSGKSVGDVFDILKLSNLRKRDFTYENLDTLQQYNAICNKEQGKQIDMLTYLRGKFSGRKPAIMYEEKEKLSQHTNPNKKARIQR